MNLINTALVQQTLTNDSTKNKENLTQAIKTAAKRKAKLVVLSELHNYLYFCQQQDPQLFTLAETIPGPSSDYFATLAKNLGIVIIISLFEKRTAGIYHNTAVVLDIDGQIAGIYRKMHIPHDPDYFEKYYFTPGDTGFKPIDTSIAKLGVMICWDQWFPEAARIMALNGADLLIYSTAIGWHPADDADEQKSQADRWITMQRAHAIANAIPIAVVNRVGFEKSQFDSKHGIDFWGLSFLANAQGKILVQADSKQSSIVQATLDLTQTDKLRTDWPILRDRRIDAYKDLLLRYARK